MTTCQKSHPQLFVRVVKVCEKAHFLLIERDVTACEKYIYCLQTDKRQQVEKHPHLTESTVK